VLLHSNQIISSYGGSREPLLLYASLQERSLNSCLTSNYRFVSRAKGLLAPAQPVPMNHAMATASALTLLRAHLDHQRTRGRTHVELTPAARTAANNLVKNPPARRSGSNPALSAAAEAPAPLGSLRAMLAEPPASTAQPAPQPAPPSATASPMPTAAAARPRTGSLLDSALHVSGAAVQEQLASLQQMA
jgi:hypothetical protein